MPEPRTILLVDGVSERRRAMRALLEGSGQRTIAAPDLASALARLEGERTALVVAAADLPTLSELVTALRERDPATQLVLIGPAPPPTALVRRYGAVAWHEPSDPPERLLIAIEAAERAHAQYLELQIAERLKTELLANVSHELRTPLNVILGYLDLVREGTFGEFPAEASGILEKARANAGWLLDLVEEFLDFSQLEVGAARLRTDPIDPLPVLRELAESFGIIMRTKPFTFVVDLPATLPRVAADPAKLRVIVQNLLANAAKFTEQGQVRLSATAGPSGGLRIVVSDTGPGIAPEHHEAVFDAFKQLAASGGPRRGIGLGLALARRFARMMGGDVTLVSAVGSGSTFTLTLPALPPSAAA